MILIYTLPILALIGFKLLLKNKEDVAAAVLAFLFAYAGLLCMMVFINEVVREIVK